VVVAHGRQVTLVEACCWVFQWWCLIYLVLSCSVQSYIMQALPLMSACTGCCLGGSLMVCNQFELQAQLLLLYKSARGGASGAANQRMSGSVSSVLNVP